MSAMNPVLVLNNDWSIDAVVPWQKAVALMLSDKVYMLVQYGERLIRSTSLALPYAAVLVRKKFARRRRVRLTRANVFARDAFTCQYCGRRPRNRVGNPRVDELSWDHVVPQGQSDANRMVVLPWSGKRVKVTSWHNLLTSCTDCNGRKGNRTPRQAGMTPLRLPAPPTDDDRAWMALVEHSIQPEWRPHLPEDSPWAVREMAFVLVGLAMIHMAYRLFLSGIDTGGAEELSVGKWIQVKGGGPGIAFACLGAGIVIYTISMTGRLELKEIVALETAYQAEHPEEPLPLPVLGPEPAPPADDE
jgi:5-methylcytosine-specific restriction endonuclease McrA